MMGFFYKPQLMHYWQCLLGHIFKPFKSVHLNSNVRWFGFERGHLTCERVDAFSSFFGGPLNGGDFD